jgi:hypothetical protein
MFGPLRLLVCILPRTATIIAMRGALRAGQDTISDARCGSRGRVSH